MHKHLKSNCIGQNQENDVAPPPAPILPPIIKSLISTKVVGSGYAFRGWNYATATVCLTLGEIPLDTDVTSLYCLNIGCGITLIDRACLFERVSTEKIFTMVTPLKVRGIEFLKHELDEFVSMSLYFPNIDLTNRLAYAHIYGKLHIVKRFKANLLEGNNILATERVIIDSCQ